VQLAVFAERGMTPSAIDRNANDLGIELRKSGLSSL